MRGITRETFSRMIDRKGAVASLVMMAIGVWIVISSDWQSIRLSFEQTNSASPYASTDEIALHFLSTYASIVTGIVCLLVARIFPAMLKPATSWYFFSRPISRGRIVIEKIWAVVIVYTGVLVATLLPVAVAAMFRYELFDSRLVEIMLVHALVCVVSLTLLCALGVLLRSTAKVIFTALAVWTAQVLLQYRADYLGSLKDTIIEPILSTLAFVLPRMSQISDGAHSIAAGVPATLLTPILMTLLSVGLTLYLALGSLDRRDL